MGEEVFGKVTSVLDAAIMVDLSGKALAISPLVLVFAVFFWSFLWGIPGAFIGVPITIAILTLCKHYPSTRWIATLLSGSVPEPQSS